MAIQDDFTIHPDTKVIRHDATASTVWSAVAFYSYLQDSFDEPGFLSYEIPIRFNTPTSFTMVNGWFLDDGDGSDLLQYLTGGGIDTLGYSTISDPVVMIDLDYAMLSFELSDKDRTVSIDGSDIGPLLSYKDDYPDISTARMWVRDINSVGSTVPGQLVTVNEGWGNYTTSGYSASGDNIYHNLFTIAAFPGSPNPQLYIYQNHPVDGARTRIGEWSSFSNFNRGSIDVLITTQLGGTLIDGGNISTFVRQTADTFSFVESTLTTSGRTPIATETAADTVNITEGEHYLLYDGSDTLSFSVGDVIQDRSTSSLLPPSWYAEVVAVEEFTGLADGVLTLRGLRGAVTDNDNIYVGTVIEGVANGTPGDTLLEFNAGTEPTSISSNTLTGSSSGAKRLLVGIETGEKYVAQDDTSITGSSRNPYYIDFTTADTITGSVNGSFTVVATTNTLISGFNDITVAHMNGRVTTGAITGTFTEGERITWSGGEAVFITGTSSPIFIGNVQNPETLNGNVITGDVSGATVTPSANLTDDNTQNFEFSLQTTGALYSVFIEGGSAYNTGRSLTDIYAYLQYYLRDGQDLTARTIYVSDNITITQTAAEEYIQADMWTTPRAYNATKAAPYGTLAGGVFFGAQAVWLQGMQASDNNNIKLTDSTGTLREPFTSITITVSNTRADDRVAIFLESGTTELPNKTQYTSDAALNALGDGTFERNTGAFPNDTPTAGTFIVVDNALNKQHRYRFTVRNGTSDPGILTMPTQLTGTADGSTASQILEDSGENFTATVQVGDIIHRTSGDLGFAYVTSVASAASGILSTTLIEDTSGIAATAWSVSDTYAIHSLVKTYTGSDTFFIPYMDEIESASGQIDVSLTYVIDREIILEVRNVEAATEIIPFKTTGTITNTGYTQGVIRNEDTVFTP